MRALVCLFLRGERGILDTIGVSLDDVSMAWRELRPIPHESVVFETPRLAF